MTWKRVATALVLIPVVVAIVLFTSTAVVAIATAIITVLALWEYFALGDAIGHRAYRLWTTFCALLLIFFQWKESYAGHASYFAFPMTNFIFITFAISIFVLGIAVLTLFSRRPLVEALPAAGISSSALLLVAFPLSFAVPMHSSPWQGPRLLLFALVITWAADTTAYFVGRAIGKHPLAPHISPKKTWEGSIGSMFGSLLVAYAFSFWIRVPLPHLLIMAAIGNIAGQMGDLLESAYKRSAGVKDSGGLLPGHGGILDRIDALILCIPVIWYYLVLVNPPAL
ncbi:MAG TPA: phosphatidate cytidylyltransferase [Candidatus Acidoferrum sp.]|jgi:phosphatidate cytidylyltransferase